MGDRVFFGHYPTGILAERVGFEPTVPCGTLDFESSTFGHSATAPEGLHRLGEGLNSIRVAKRPGRPGRGARVVAR